MLNLYFLFFRYLLFFCSRQLSFDLEIIISD